MESATSKSPGVEASCVCVCVCVRVCVCVSHRYRSICAFVFFSFRKAAVIVFWLSPVWSFLSAALWLGVEVLFLMKYTHTRTSESDNYPAKNA